jgi:hypothetical protein
MLTIELVNGSYFSNSLEHTAKRISLNIRQARRPQACLWSLLVTSGLAEASLKMAIDPVSESQ